MKLTRRGFLATTAAAAAAPRIPAKTVVLTLDDAVKSHRTFAAPLLKELGFGATFFVTQFWMDDRERFMTWQDIAEIHRMGFEIGNHTWTHADFSSPRNAARLAGELALVESELKTAGVPRPVSFAWPGNFFGPEALAIVRDAGYRFARRGEMPEVEYGKAEVGARFDPRRHHRLLIPTTGDAYPNWTFEHFRHVVSHAVEGEAVVLQFHGVPDLAHSWVHTPPERFEQYMRYLKQEGYNVIALRDLAGYIAEEAVDPLLKSRHRQRDRLALPVEMEATRANLAYWLGVMQAHRYTAAEITSVAGPSDSATLRLPRPAPVLPYPGGRHTRTGFLEGAIDPLRGTKASIFLPWDPTSYVVVDLPEAIFSNLGLLFLAHTHIPTLWNRQNKVIDNIDWRHQADGSLVSRWTLPNAVQFGAQVKPAENGIDMELWLANGTAEPLTRLRTQICVLLKGAPEFAAPSNDNKIFKAESATVSNAAGDRWLITSWERTGRTWGNAACPCVHADPVLPDCAPGATVRVRGRLRFTTAKPE